MQHHACVDQPCWKEKQPLTPNPTLNPGPLFTHCDISETLGQETVTTRDTNQNQPGSGIKTIPKTRAEPNTFQSHVPGTLCNSSLSSLESAPIKARVEGLQPLFLLSPEILSSVAPWLLMLRWPAKDAWLMRLSVLTGDDGGHLSQSLWSLLKGHQDAPGTAVGRDKVDFPTLSVPGSSSWEEG